MMDQNDILPKQINTLLQFGLTNEDIISMIKDYPYPEDLIDITKLIKNCSENSGYSEQHFYPLNDMKISLVLNVLIGESNNYGGLDNICYQDNWEDNANWFDVLNQISDVFLNLKNSNSKLK